MLVKVNQIIQGDCVEVMASIPAGSVDLIFADPPYNLQLQNELHRPDMSKVAAVNDAWDQFESFADYDAFTLAWLTASKRILKPTGTIWVIGSYHNIFRVGRIMQDLGFWILNDVIWIKTNPMPNFRGVRFTNAHETLIWASTGKGQSYTFNHHAMKGLNDDKQMRSDWWLLSLTPQAERLRNKIGGKGHSTQKPEALLYRVILSSTRPNDLILDPFFGSGTTGVVAKRLHRDWIGIEIEQRYVELAQKRIDATRHEEFDESTFDVRSQRKLATRIPFSVLLEYGYIHPGQQLYFRKDRSLFAHIKPDARLVTKDGFVGSIHRAGTHYMNGSPCNGWEHWYLEEAGKMVKIDDLRQRFRSKLK
jgi:site-specific DNA-methyltransferase (adenine-specific)